MDDRLYAGNLRMNSSLSLITDSALLVVALETRQCTNGQMRCAQMCIVKSVQSDLDVCTCSLILDYTRRYWLNEHTYICHIFFPLFLEEKKKLFVFHLFNWIKSWEHQERTTSAYLSCSVCKQRPRAFCISPTYIVSFSLFLFYLIFFSTVETIHEKLSARYFLSRTFLINLCIKVEKVVGAW